MDAGRATVATHTTFRTEQTELFNTNEPQVTVDYEIDHGPSGVSKVEVYLTQDEGRTWVKWQELSRNDLNRGEAAPAAAPTNKLPVTVRMPDREGTFVFRLVPCSGAQISAGAPQNGTEPEFRIQYDRTSHMSNCSAGSRARAKERPRPSMEGDRRELRRQNDPHLLVRATERRMACRECNSIARRKRCRRLGRIGKYNWKCQRDCP